MKKSNLFVRLLLLIFIFTLTGTSCSRKDPKNKPGKDSEVRYITKRRADGTASSFSPVNKDGYIHGLRITFYKDGKSVYSRVNYKNGSRHGKATYYYKNGNPSLVAAYNEGKRDGLAKKYYENGKLRSVCEYENGFALPGLKEYRQDGTLITDYPEIQFKEIDELAENNRIILELSCADKRSKVEYYIPDNTYGNYSRIYLISENSSASQTYYLAPGKSIDKDLEFVAVITTKSGNKLVKTLKYHLKARNY